MLGAVVVDDFFTAAGRGVEVIAFGASFFGLGLVRFATTGIGIEVFPGRADGLGNFGGFDTVARLSIDNLARLTSLKFLIIIRCAWGGGVSRMPEGGAARIIANFGIGSSLALAAIVGQASGDGAVGIDKLEKVGIRRIFREGEIGGVVGEVAVGDEDAREGIKFVLVF